MRYELSYHQERIWFIDQFERDTLYKGGPTYHNIPIILRSKESVDINLLNVAIQYLVKRHTILRAYVNTQDESAYLELNSSEQYKVIFHHFNGDESEDKIISFLFGINEMAFIEGIDKQLFQVYCLKTKSMGQYVMFTIHHLICDDYSKQLICQEFLDIYNSLKNHQEISLPKLETDYMSYGKWQKEIPEQYIEKEYFYWKRKTKKKIAVLELPIDQKRAAIHIYKANTLTYVFSQVQVHTIQNFCKKYNISYNDMFLAVFKIVLMKFSRQKEINIGTSMYRRRGEKLQNVVGPFSNLAVLCDEIDDNSDFISIINKISKTYYDAETNCKIPFDKLVIKLNPKNDMSRTALFDVIFNYIERDDTIDNYGFEIINNNRGYGKYDYNLLIENKGKNLELFLTFNELYYKDSTAQTLIDSFVTMLDRLIQQPKKEVYLIPCYSQKDYELEIKKWNDEDKNIEFINDISIDQMFINCVKNYGDHEAVVYGNDSVTYKELNNRCNKVALILKKNGVKKENFVALIMDKGIDCISTMLGILRVGACYVPIEPTLPKERIDFMLQDCNPSVIVVEPKYKEIVSNYENILMIDTDVVEQNEAKSEELCTNNLAYVIYTSGTTGKPKGMMIEHHNVVSLIQNGIKLFHFNEKDRWTMFHSYNFDFSVWEMYGPLLTGGCVVIVDKSTARNTVEFRKLLFEQKITILNQTPLAFYSLMEEEMKYASHDLLINKVIFGGEVLQVTKLKNWKDNYPNCELINMYGITETTVHVTYKFISKEEIAEGKNSIGIPLPSYEAFVVDHNLKIVPIGVPGELLIGGTGVGRGYINRDELTKQKFVYSNLKGNKLYRSGDLARWLPDGSLEYLGRIDDQVKIRGFRVELGEIETLIANIPQVTGVAVITRENKEGDKAIYAYYLSDELLDEEYIRRELAKKVPDYMLPAYMMQLDSFPMTSNGKLDRKSLPDIQAHSKEIFIRPETETEILVAELFAEVLEIDVNRVGTRDNFFELGGHSLRATKLLNQIEAKTGIRISLKDMFSNPTVKVLADYITNNKRKVYQPIPFANKKDYYLMSASQRRMYMLCQNDTTSTMYNMPFAVKIYENLNIEKLRESLQQMMKLNEILHTSFLYKNGEYVQFIDENATLEFKIFEDESIEDEKIIKNFVKPFKLEKAPCFRAAVIKRDDYCIMLIDMHHIIGDGISDTIFINELLGLYKHDILPEISKQYKDYSEWMHHRDFSSQEYYWLQRFSVQPPILDLPLDYLRPKKQSFEGKRLMLTTTNGLRAKVKKLANKLGGTEFMVLLSGLMILLSKYSRQEDIVIGSPVNGRTHPDTEKMLGVFINTLPLRGNIEKNKNYLQLFEQLKEVCLSAFENQEYPFEELIEKINIMRDYSRNPLFDVMMTLNNDEYVSEIEKEYSAKPIEFEGKSARFDLLFQIFTKDTEYSIDLEYCTALFKDFTAQMMLEHFVCILEQLLSDEEKQISDFEVITEQEKEVLLPMIKERKCKYPQDKSVVDLFYKQAEKHPNKIALISEEEKISLTYKELNEKSNGLAQKLINAGINHGDTIVIIPEKKANTIICVLSILKAGGIYVPIDSKNPEERIKDIISDCNPKIIVSNNIYSDISVPVWQLDQLSFDLKDTFEKNTYLGDADDVAYIIYTSGTTGISKGVMVNHKNIVNLVKTCDYVKLNEETSLLQSGQLAFDASTFEIWGSLLNGGTLHIITEDILLNVRRLKDYLVRNNINTLFLTTALFNLIVKQDVTVFDTIKWVLFGGEKASEEHVNKLRKHNKYSDILNMYGPTETTTFATWYKISDTIEHLPIGRAINNVELYVVDNNNLCGFGVPGELCIAGAGVAKGYLNKEKLTSERFVKNLFGEGRMYKTGDLVRMMEDGNIDYLGRIDEQVKIRGFRIELEEISSTINKIDGIIDCVVVVQESLTDKFLCAFFVSNTHIDVETIKMELHKSLPAYMVPTYIMQIDKLPLNPNGKVDKRALPHIELKNDIYVKPETETEKILCNIVSEVLEISEIGINHNFFELGGHSLKAMFLINRIEEEFGCKVSLKDVFEVANNKQLAAYIDTLDKGNFQHIPNVEEKAYYEAANVQKRLYSLWKIAPESTVYNMPVAIEVDKKASIEKIEEVIHQLVKRHEIFRTEFKEVDEKIVQIILPKVQIEINTFCINESQLPKILQEFIIPFDYGHAPLVHISIVKTETNRWIVLFDMPHIISDGQSMKILAEEFQCLYKGEELPIINIQYKDYSEWSLKRNLREDELYWAKIIKKLPVLELPTDRKRPTVQSFCGMHVRTVLSTDEYDGIKKLAGEYKTTDNIIFLSILMILLSMYSNQQDVVIGTPVLGRTHKDTERLLGMFVNTIVISGKVEKDNRISNFLKTMISECTEAYNHQDFPFDRMVEMLDKPRELSRNPLFDVMYVFQDQMSTLKSNDLWISEAETAEGNSKFDLSFIISSVLDSYSITLEFCTDLYVMKSAERFLIHFKNLIHDIIEKPYAKISELSVVGKAEQSLILNNFEKHITYLPNSNTIMEQLVRIVEKYPEQIALVSANRSMTYKEFNDLTNKFAAGLQYSGIVKGDIIGIITKKNFETICSIISVIKAGAVYLPVDEALPIERITYMIDDCKPKMIITIDNYVWKNKIESHIKGEVTSYNEILMRGEKSQYICPSLNCNDLAYIIYTSGTTGKPKGTLVEHSGVVNLGEMFVNDFKVTSKDIILQFANYVFDASIWEITMALLTGATLAIPDLDVVTDMKKFVAFLAEQHVTIATLPPQYYEQLQDAISLRILITAGSEASAKIVRKAVVLNDIYINAYGPTETTVCATYWKYDSNTYIDKCVPIGRPIPNMNVFILQGNTLCGIGMIGEICVSGIGVSRGYLNQQELTKNKFVDNPFSTGKLYRTGDLGRWKEDGNIEFLGRIDDQLKIRGYRIELREIESCIKEISNISDSVVICQKNKDSECLVAYYVSKVQIQPELILEHLRRYLPEYMIPNLYMQIDSIPITINGKVDKKALPVVEWKGVIYEQASTQEEIILADLFEKILGIQNCGIYENFYQVGGDSIKAIRMISRLNELGYEIKINDFLLAKNIKQIAKNLKKKEVKHRYSQLPISGELSLAPIQSEFFNWNLNNKSHFNQSVLLEFLMELDEEKVIEIFNCLTKHHDILRLNFQNDGKQRIRGIEEGNLYDYESCDLKGMDDTEVRKYIEKHNNDVQQSMVPEFDPLVKIVLYRCDKKNYLFIVIHHMAIDIISWQILMDDFSKLYMQNLNGKELQPTPKTASYKEWFYALSEYAYSERALEEIDYWNMLSKKVHSTKKPLFEKGCLKKTILSFVPTETERLLKLCNVLSVEFLHVLVGGIAYALCNNEGDSICIEIEGHGRNQEFSQLSVEHTVGWFTNKYPVLIYKRQNLEQTIIDTKNAFSRTPHNGLGYGILTQKGMCKPIPAKVLVNYFGNSNIENKSELFVESSLSKGQESAIGNIPFEGIMFNCDIVNKKLNINIQSIINQFNNKSLEEIINKLYHVFSYHDITDNDTVADWHQNMTEDDISDILDMFE